MIFSRSSAALISFTERGNSSTNSLNTGPLKHAAHAGNFFEFGRRETRFRQILQRQLAQAFFADQAQMNRRGQRVESFVGADIRGGLLAADVLLARGERKHEAAAAGCVGGLSGEAARHLANEFFARGDHADIRPAVTWRNAEGSGLPWRRCRPPQAAARCRARRASAIAVTSSAPARARLPRARQIFKNAEKVRRLHDDGCRVALASPRHRSAIELARLRVADLLDFQPQIFRVGVKNLPVFGMHRARDQHATAAR